MKAKMDPEMMKEFALNHAEKAIFAIFVLVFCSMVWSSAFSLKGIDATPDQLKRLTETARINIGAERKVHIPIVDYESLAMTTTRPVSSENLRMEVALMPRIWNDRKLREQPRVYSVENIQVVSGRWRVPYRQDARTGGTLDDDDFAVQQRSPTQGVYGTIILGAIPYDKQVAAFEEALGKPPGSARNVAKRDEPTYHLYEIQRAEVPSNWNGDAAGLKWEDFRVRKTGGLFAQNLDIIKTMYDIRGRSSDTLGLQLNTREVVEDEKPYVPPHLMRRDERAAAVARRDTVIDERGLVPDTYLTLMNPLPQVDASGQSSSTDWLATLKFPAGINIGQPVKAVRGTGGTATAVEAADELIFVDEEPLATRSSYSSEEKRKPMRLFSYVDYTVEPGKTYVYRVKLELHNPNYLYQPTQLVANEEITRTQYLPTGWSEISKPATIGADISILAAGAEVLTGDKTPSPALMLVQFDTATGYELACRFNKIGMWQGDSPEELQKLSVRERKRRIDETKDLRLPFLNGMLLDLKADETMMRPLSTSSYSGYSNTQQTPIIRDYPTNYILLDTKLTKTEVVPELKESDRMKNPPSSWDFSAIYAPTRMLLLELTPDGKPLRMVIQSEVEDYQEVYARGVEPQRSSSSYSAPAPTPTRATGRATRTTQPRTTGGGGRFGGAQLN